MGATVAVDQPGQAELFLCVRLIARLGPGFTIAIIASVCLVVGSLLAASSVALPVAAGVCEPLGFVLRPEVGAISMAGSSIIVALNAVALKRLRLPARRSRA